MFLKIFSKLIKNILRKIQIFRYVNYKFRILFMYFFKVHGCYLNDDIRLKIGLFNGLLHLKRSGSLGSYICGNKSLIIKTWDGYKFYIRPGTGDIGLATLVPEYYELINWFIPNAKGVVIDIGACTGGYTVRASSIANLVIAIEPQKYNFNILRRNVNINFNSKNVILINKAIGNSKGVAKLRLPINMKWNIGAYSIVKHLNNKNIIEEVQVDTLDNIISSLGLKRINLIKIDIEGALKFALKGMVNTFKITDKIIVEIFEENEWLIDEIKQLNFKLIDKKNRNYFFIKNPNNYK